MGRAKARSTSAVGHVLVEDDRAVEVGGELVDVLVAQGRDLDLVVLEHGALGDRVGPGEVGDVAEEGEGAHVDLAAVASAAPEGRELGPHDAVEVVAAQHHVLAARVPGLDHRDLLARPALGQGGRALPGDVAAAGPSGVDLLAHTAATELVEAVPERPPVEVAVLADGRQLAPRPVGAVEEDLGLLGDAGLGREEEVEPVDVHDPGGDLARVPGHLGDAVAEDQLGALDHLVGHVPAAAVEVVLEAQLLGLGIGGGGRLARRDRDRGRLDPQAGQLVLDDPVDDRNLELGPAGAIDHLLLGVAALAAVEGVVIEGPLLALAARVAGGEPVVAHLGDEVAALLIRHPGEGLLDVEHPGLVRDGH